MRTSSIPIENNEGAYLGDVIETSAEAQQAVANGWRKCENTACHFYASPEGVDWLTERQNEDYDCPNCGQNQDLLERIDKDLDNQHRARAGMSLSEFGKMGEVAVNTVVAASPEWKEKYGEIIWWQPGVESLSSGGSAEHGRLDGLSRGPDGTIYGIEVKSANVDNNNPEFIINKSDRARKHDYAANYATHEPELSNQLGIQSRMNVSVPDHTAYKNAAEYRAAEAETYTQGNNDIDALLAVLPVFDFNNSMVDVYVKETPLSGWQGSGGLANTTYYGFGKFRARPYSNPDQYTFLKGIPFENPFMDPHNTTYPIVKTEQIYNPRAPTDDELLFKDHPQFGSADDIWEEDQKEMPF